MTGFRRRSLRAVLLAGLCLGFGLAGLPEAAETSDAHPSADPFVHPDLSPTLLQHRALRDALEQASAYGRRSLLASVVENVRLTPARAAAVAAVATAVDPGLRAEIGLAARSGLELANQYSGSRGTDAARSLPPGADPETDLAFVSEFDRNYGLAAIGADRAVDLGLTGRGVTVGVLDSGIDISPDGTVHSEFAGRIDPRSRSFLHWFDGAGLGPDPTDEEMLARFVQGNRTMDLNGHGTHVAGTIGAARDGQGMQGVAPGVTLLAVKSIPQSGELENGLALANLEVCGPALRFDRCEFVVPGVDPVARGLLYLAEQNDVRVINGSFGPVAPGRDQTTWNFSQTASLDSVVNQAISARHVLDAGQILVMAAGNERIYNPVLAENPLGIGLKPFIRPASSPTVNSAGAVIYDDGGAGVDFSFLAAENLAAAEAADGHQRGRIVVVVALDARNDLASFSNKCGVAREWCIAAPGGDQPAAALDDVPQDGDRGILSTWPVNDYRHSSGTSMAAPHVAGAVAVLIEAYPAFSPADIVRILFETAEDLGAPGIDPVFGWGLLRLDRALSGPVGLNPASTGVYQVDAGSSRQDWMFGFNSAGGFHKYGSGSLGVMADITFAQPGTVADGMLLVDGVLTTPELAILQAGGLGGGGAVVSDITLSGLLSPGASPGTLTVVGNLALQPTATTLIEIDGRGVSGGAGSHDRIIVEGEGSVFTAAGRLVPRLRQISGAATNSFVPSVGDVFTFVSVPQGRVEGGFSSLVQPTDGLPAGTRMDVLYGAQSLGLAATPQRYGALDQFGLSMTANERSLGNAIDSVRPEPGRRPDSRSNDAFNALYQADLAALDRDLNTLTGQIHAEMTTTAIRSVGRFADTIEARQMDRQMARQTNGMPDERGVAGSVPYGAGRFWVSADGSRSEVGQSGDITGFTSRAAGFAIGVDRRRDAIRFGLAGSFDTIGVSAGTNGSGSVTSYQAAAYAAVDTGVAELAVRGGVGYSDISTDRPTNMGRYVAAATSDSRGVGGFAEATAFRSLDAGSLTITPSLGLGYRFFDRSSLSETGSAFALDAGQRTVEHAHATAGIRLSHDFTVGADTTITPSVALAWRSDLSASSRSQTVSLFGADYRVKGAEIGSDAFLGRVDLMARASDTMALGASWQSEIRDNLQSHAVNARLSIRF